ncbi:MAG: 6-phosphofructokinase [[Eubacterium] sulci]|nr:6-phosphofructokinase [[Eubacterium] sulci]MBF1177404.1 6-phosphofructokinase [[Eubacterium] sulci]MBF1189151.1 6-phosphofructokinase [[Eubacterium] sulci]
MKIGVLTSGGDAPGMNAAIRAVVRCGIDAGFEVYGIKRGYEGLLDGEIERMSLSSVGDILHRGGTILKTARSERFSTEEGVKRSKVILGTFGIDALIVIGGDGSMRGALELSKLGINVMCLPGTIDNDLAYTDYTIGFDTAVNTVLDAISKVRDTSSAHERNTIIEVMGRHCGDIALYAGVGGGAEAVLIPEVEADVNRVCRKILQGAGRGKLNSIIINAEGSGVSSDELAKEIAEVTGRETRIVVLSYLQRGGVPTLDDRLLASQSGAKAIELIQNGIQNKAIGTVNGKIQAFEIEGALSEKCEFDHELYELIDVLSK